MKITRNIIGFILVALAVTMLAVVGLASAGNATEVDNGPGTHYTDGTEDYTGAEFCIPLTEAVCGPEGLGPPPEAPHFETLDGVSNICIDPPSFVDVTFHFTDRESIVANYNGEVILHDVAHTCVPVEPPVCPEEQTDQQVTIDASWNIGSGRSEALVVDLDCTPEVPVPPVVPPVELAPPIVPVVETVPACVVGKTCLADTGVGPFTWLEVIAGVVMVMSGLLIGRIVQLSRQPSRRGLYRGNQ